MKKLIAILTFVFGLYAPSTYANLETITAAMNDSNTTYYEAIQQAQADGEPFDVILRALIDVGVSSRLIAGIVKKLGYSYADVSNVYHNLSFMRNAYAAQLIHIGNAINSLQSSSTITILVVEGGSSAGVGIDISGA